MKSPHPELVQTDAESCARARLLASQLAELSLRERSSILLAWPAILTIVWVHRNAVPVEQIVGWLIGMVTFLLLRFRLATAPVATASLPALLHQRNHRVAITIMYGAGWGAMMFLLDTGNLDFLFMFKFASLAAVLGVTANAMGVLLPVYLGFITPLILLLVAFLVTAGGYQSTEAEASLLIGVGVYCTLLVAAAKNINRLTRIAFESGFERDAALQEARDSHQREFLLRERLAILARKDELTGAFNRRHLSEELERQVQTLDRHDIGFSIILLDVDHFKCVNDNLGHQVGDYVLVGLSSLMTDMLREIDIFGRWGGEEFLCILPNSSHEEASACAERLRAGLENARLVPNIPELVVTASFGVVVGQRDETVEGVMRRVDEALYEAKTGGRNRVVAKGMV